MKRLFQTLFIIIFITGCSKINSKSDWQKLGLKGRVKSLKETSYESQEKNGIIETGKPFLEHT